jgi:hypothetical protein
MERMKMTSRRFTRKELDEFELLKFREYTSTYCNGEYHIGVWGGSSDKKVDIGSILPVEYKLQMGLHPCKCKILKNKERPKSKRKKR